MNIEKAAEMIIWVCKKLSENKMVGAFDGNVSVRLSDGTIMATPTMTSKGEVTKESLVLLDPAGNPLSDGKASSEIKMHLRCYEMREDIGGVVHSHAPASTAFACTGKPFDCRPFSAGLMNFGDEVPCAPFAVAGTTDVPDSIMPYIKDNNAILLANHGVLTVGKDVKKAYFLMETLENITQTAINLKIIGGAVNVPERGAEELKKKFH